MATDSPVGDPIIVPVDLHRALLDFFTIYWNEVGIGDRGDGPFAYINMKDLLLLDDAAEKIDKLITRYGNTVPDGH